MTFEVWYYAAQKSAPPKAGGSASADVLDTESEVLISYAAPNRWPITHKRNPTQASEISDADVTISIGKMRRRFGLDATPDA